MRRGLMRMILCDGVGGGRLLVRRLDVGGTNIIDIYRAGAFSLEEPITSLLLQLARGFSLVSRARPTRNIVRRSNPAH